ncbi:beta-ketoacyl-[acyl-carrier-protein] synthase family protein [bacterium]|jgi:3-oxoacyl-[acyl-carrier-protein] synthase II|nr:beta-ketoacyl-[acyl-carrier-protein] synthase family protein [Gemmataceae bacterium]NBS88576.1 beta-ketoacyl-[acyl-carrier-protein] synthase family protein [bacterium]NBT60240.1 beta-ketoacyl-[acyl-carrier-protein] synthase family protein [Planctomycetia bacterium]
MDEEIWITGVGVGCPMGFSLAEFSKMLLEGKSAVRKVELFDITNHPSQIAAYIDEVPASKKIPNETFRSRSKAEQLYIHCMGQAIADADIEKELTRENCGLLLGTGSDWLLSWEENFFLGGDNYKLPGRETAPYFQFAKDLYQIEGPVLQVSTACASANHSLIFGANWLKMGLVDICIVGACSINVTPITLASFGNLRALSRRNDAPEQASRPFDKGRDGFVLGEGGAIFILEKASHAKNRRASCHGKILGGGFSSDAFHPVIPNPDTSQIEIAIKNALNNSQTNLDAVDYINAHGTSTPVGDAGEANAIRNVFANQFRNIPVSSIKSMAGHALAASSAIEAAACLVALQHQAIPPTINLENLDPACDLNHVANTTVEKKLKRVVSNSFGFGGSNSCIVLGKA